MALHPLVYPEKTASSAADRGSTSASSSGNNSNNTTVSGVSPTQVHHHPIIMNNLSLSASHSVDSTTSSACITRTPTCSSSSGGGGATKRQLHGYASKKEQPRSPASTSSTTSSSTSRPFHNHSASPRTSASPRATTTSSTLHNKKKGCGLFTILRVFVLTFSVVFILGSILQGQHLQQQQQQQPPLLQGLGIDKAAMYQPHKVTFNQYQYPLNALPHQQGWKLPTSGSSNSVVGVGAYDAQSFQDKLNHWRFQSNRLQLNHPQHIPQANVNGNVNPLVNPHHNHDSRLLSSVRKSQEQNYLNIPFWQQQTLFKRRNAWQLMTVIMATDCLPKYTSASTSTQASSQEEAFPMPKYFPSLLTIQDALRTHHADIVVYLPQTPESHLFPKPSKLARGMQVSCQAKFVATLQSLYSNDIQSGKLQIVQGVVNPLPSRIKFHYHHKIGPALREWKEAQNFATPELSEAAATKLRRRFRKQQLALEVEHSLGLDFAYVAELVYEHGDLLLFLTPGTRLIQSVQNNNNSDGNNNNNNNLTKAASGDYGFAIVEQYEHFRQRRDTDHLIHRVCYMSFLQQDAWMELPRLANYTEADLPPRHQTKLILPTGIVLEKHGLYRLSMVLRSLLPYHKDTTTQLLLKYCTELLWEAQIVQPLGDGVFQQWFQHQQGVEQKRKEFNITLNPNITENKWEQDFFPPAIFTDHSHTNGGGSLELPPLSPEIVQEQLQSLQQQQEALQQMPTGIPPWVTMDNSQLGPQRNTNPASLLQLPADTPVQHKQRLITFVVPTATRPNNIKNQYVIFSLNKLFPLIRRDFKTNHDFDATVLLVVCGNTQDELDDHQKGLWEYYGPEIKEGILEIVSTNLETYPSLHNLPNNYNDPENRLRWRSKQNLDISSSFFAAKGKSKYIMLLEDDTGYRDGFTPTLKNMLQADAAQEAALQPDLNIAPIGVEAAVAARDTKAFYADDFKQHVFAQIHFGFGYSGVLIHDDDALVYAVLHYVLMDEKPCDLLYLANYLQGKILDQKFRWQLKKVLITHLGSLSTLAGKIQPVWGLKG